MTKTKIEWADYTWNPITGCSPISEGCQNCYAAAIAKRFWKDRKFSDVELHHDRLGKPLKIKEPSRIFVNSMSDLFHDKVPFNFVLRVFLVMADAPQHKFLILTKRPARMKRFLTEWLPKAFMSKNMEMKFLSIPLPNVWLGVTAETQQRFDERVPLLLQTPAAVRFVSIEPMLEEINTRKYINDIDLVICGAETGSHKRRMKIEDALSVRDQCHDAGIPFYFKKDSDVNHTLDGETYEELPQIVTNR